MKTQSVGELLSAARQRARLSLEDLAVETRIQSEYLEALEANDFEVLPEAVFVKAMIRNYARVLSLDAAPLLAVLRRDYEESARGQLIPREYLFPVLRKRQFWSPVRLLVLAAVAVFVMVSGYAAWKWYQMKRPPELIVQEPTEAAVVSATLQVQGKSTADTVVTVNGQPVALRQDGSFTAEVNFPEEGPTNISIKVTDKKGRSSMVQRSVLVQF